MQQAKGRSGCEGTAVCGPLWPLHDMAGSHQLFGTSKGHCVSWKCSEAPGNVGKPLKLWGIAKDRQSLAWLPWEDRCSHTPLEPEDRTSLACTPRSGRWPWAPGMDAPMGEGDLAAGSRSPSFTASAVSPLSTVATGQYSMPVSCKCSWVGATGPPRWPGAALIQDPPATEVQISGGPLLLSQELQMLLSLSCASLPWWHFLPGSVPFPRVRHVRSRSSAEDISELLPMCRCAAGWGGGRCRDDWNYMYT